MQEIEVKILNIHRKKIEQKILDLGAQQTFDGIIHTNFYDNQNHDIQTKQNLLRLRTIGSKTYLTFKQYQPSTTQKKRLEYEIEVSDFQTTNTLLNLLGYSSTLSINKQRTSYILDTVHFEIDKHLDTYQFIPEFLEIEAPSSTLLSKYVHLLGFTEKDCKPWSFFDVTKHYQNQKNKQKITQ